MSFYKLPGPWNPGYVIPKYVQAEPPERGTITTQMLPRGTIPQLIPDYLAVKDPPVRVTSTLAQHSLKGTCFDDHSLAGHTLGNDSLGASEYSLEPLGNPAAPFTKYGAKVAANLMARMQRLPNNQRATVMKKTLAAIDKTLPARAEQHAKAYKARGMSAPAALQAGIAKAVSDGAIGEISRLGRKGGSVSRRVAPSGALRGRGRSLMALGALPLSTAKMDVSTAPVISGPSQSSDYCRKDANGVDQFVWIAPTATQAGYWQRLASGQTCSNFVLDSTQTPTSVTVHAPGSQVATPSASSSYRAVQVGPFQFPADAKESSVFFWGKKLPPDWQEFIRRVATATGSQTPTQYNPSLGYFFDQPVRFNQDYVGGNPNNGSYPYNLLPSWNPVAKVKHPDSGDDYGVFLAIGSRYKDRPLDPTNNPPTLSIVWAKIDKSWYEDVWDWIQNLVGTIVDVIKDGVDAVKDATCDLLTQPGIDQAAVGAAAATPSPQTAGLAAGVVIGQQLCGGAKPMPQGPMPGAPSGTGWLLPVAVGGGLLLVYALTR